MAQPREDREQRNPTQQHAQEQSRIEPKRDERSSLARQRDRDLGMGRRDFFSPLDPFGMLRTMRQEMDRIFGGFGTLSPSTTSLGETLWSPQIEMFERNGKLIVQADLPGMTKDDVHVDLEENLLRIGGERKHEQKEEREGYYHSERSYGTFSRTIPLPEGVNAENANATFHDGVLEITMDAPRIESSHRRQIEIHSGEPRTKKS